MECAICFNECKIFKVLQCGHFFCAQCIGDLAKAPSPAVVQNGHNAAAASKSSGGRKTKGDSAVVQSGAIDGQSEPSSTDLHVESDSTDVHKEPTETKGIPCPQCRLVTSLSYCLKNKFVGDLLCRECDEMKNISEFRWCHDCAAPSCSRCFMDKHSTIDPVTAMVSMHHGVKWDGDYPQAMYCVLRMKRDAEQADETIVKNRAYVKAYLEGLQEYLEYEIEQKVKSGLKPKARQIQAICQSYTLNANTCDRGIVLKNVHKNYDTLLDEVLNLAGLDHTNDDGMPVEATLKLKCLPYKEMAQLLLGDPVNAQNAPRVATEPGPKMVRASMGDHIKDRLGITTVVGVDVVKHPSDVYYFEPLNIILVTDYHTGLKVLDPVTLQSEVIWSRKEIARYSQISGMPVCIGGAKNFNFAIKVLCEKDKTWTVAFLQLNRKTGSGKVSADVEDILKHPPSTIKESHRMASSPNGLYFQTNLGIYHHFKGNADANIYSTVYETPSQVEQLGTMGSILRDHSGINAEICISVVNEFWKTVDLMFYNEKLCKLVGRKRVEMEFPITKNTFLTRIDQCGSTNIIIADKRDTKLILWNVGVEDSKLPSRVCGLVSKSGKSFEELYEFKSKLPQKILCTPGFLWFIFKNKTDQSVRQLEVVGVE